MPKLKYRGGSCLGWFCVFFPLFSLWFNNTLWNLDLGFMSSFSRKIHFILDVYWWTFSIDLSNAELLGFSEILTNLGWFCGLEVILFLAILVKQFLGYFEWVVEEGEEVEKEGGCCCVFGCSFYSRWWWFVEVKGGTKMMVMEINCYDI